MGPKKKPHQQYCAGTKNQGIFRSLQGSAAWASPHEQELLSSSLLEHGLPIRMEPFQTLLFHENIFKIQAFFSLKKKKKTQKNWNHPLIAEDATSRLFGSLCF